MSEKGRMYTNKKVKMANMLLWVYFNHLLQKDSQIQCLKKKHCIPFLVKGLQASISFPYRSLVTLPFPGMLFSALGKVGSNVSFIL